MGGGSRGKLSLGLVLSRRQYWAAVTIESCRLIAIRRHSIISSAHDCRRLSWNRDDAVVLQCQHLGRLTPTRWKKTPLTAVFDENSTKKRQIDYRLTSPDSSQTKRRELHQADAAPHYRDGRTERRIGLLRYRHNLIRSRRRLASTRSRSLSLAGGLVS